MEQKRSNLQAVPKSHPSKSQILKTASDVSLTPSQAAELAKVNSPKNPLDALSRMSLRPQNLEKRSGLQDVDDNFLKANVFTKPSNRFHSGLDENVLNTGIQPQNMIAAGLSLNPQNGQTDSVYKLQTGVGDQQQQQQQQQSQQQQQQQQQKQPQQAQIQQAQQQAQQQQQGYPQQIPQQPPHHKGHHQQQPSHKDPNAPIEADMCTTCPNCQTTIYLVRGPEIIQHEQQQQPAGGNAATQAK